MAKKKPQYPKRKAQIIRSCVITAAVVIVAGAAVAAGLLLDKQSKSWVARVDGQKVSAETLRYFAIESAMSGANDPVSGGFDQMASYYALEKAAKSLGISRSAEALAKAPEDIETYKSVSSQIGLPAPQLTDAQLTDYLTVTDINEQLANHYTADYTVDEAAFEEAFADYYANEKQRYVDAQLKYIFNTDEEKVDAAVTALAEGMSFDDAVRAFSSDYNADTREETAGAEANAITPVSLKDLAVDKEMAETIMALRPGERTGKLSFGEDGAAFLVFELESMRVPSEEEVRATFRESYTTEKKEALFNEEMQKWLEQTNLEKHDKGYNAFKLY